MTKTVETQRTSNTLPIEALRKVSQTLSFSLIHIEYSLGDGSQIPF